MVVVLVDMGGQVRSEKLMLLCVSFFLIQNRDSILTKWEINS